MIVIASSLRPWGAFAFLPALLTIRPGVSQLRRIAHAISRVVASPCDGMRRPTAGRRPASDGFRRSPPAWGVTWRRPFSASRRLGRLPGLDKAEARLPADLQGAEPAFEDDAVLILTAVSVHRSR